METDKINCNWNNNPNNNKKYHKFISQLDR